MNLLTIDDDYDTTEAVTDYCKIQRIDCKVANKGRQGLFEIQKREYDLILLDIAMPEFTGYDILSQLKKQGVRYKTIVILTACCSKMEDFKDYTEVGVIEIVKKPVGLDHLDNVVKSYLMNAMQTDPNDFLSNQ